MRTVERPYLVPLALLPGAEPPTFIDESGALDLAIRVPAPFKPRARAVPVCKDMSAFEAFATHHEGLWEEYAVARGEGHLCYNSYALPVNLLELFSLMSIADSAGKWEGLPEYLVVVDTDPSGGLRCSTPIALSELHSCMHLDLGSARLSILNAYTAKVHIPRESQGS